MKTIATPPGVTLAELLVEHNITPHEFCATVDWELEFYQLLLNGEVELTPQIAHELEKVLVLGFPAEFWIILEQIYRDRLQSKE